MTPLTPWSLPWMVEQSANLMDSVPILLWYADVNQTWREVNGYCQKFLGCTDSQKLAEGWGEHLHPDDRLKWYQCYQKAQQQPQSYQIDYRLRSQDGHYYWMLETITPLQDEQGNSTGWVGSAVDITESKQYQIELEKNLQELASEAKSLSATVGICHYTLEGKFTRVNQTFSRLLGYSWSELLNRCHWELTHPADRELEKIQIQSLLNQEITSYTLEKRYFNAQGLEIWVLVTVSQLQTASENEPQLIAIVQDIRDRKAAEFKLRKSEANLKTAEQLTHVGNWEFDLNTQQITWSDEVFRIFNRDPAEGPPDYETIMQMVHPDDREFWQQQVQNCSLHGIPYSFHHRLMTPQKQLRQIYAQGQADQINGKTVRLFGVVMDVTEQKQIEKNLRDSQEQLEQLIAQRTTELSKTQKFLESVLQTLPVGVVAKEAKELRFTLWNQAASDLLGYTSQEMLGKNDYDFFPPEQADFFTQIDRQVLQSQQIIDIPEEEIQTKTGETRIFHTRKTTILDDEGNPAYLLAITEDITERKQKELALQDSEKQFRAIVEQAAVGINHVNLEGRFTWFNQRMCDIVSYSREELLTLTYQDVTHPDDLDIDEKCVQELLLGKANSYSLEKRYLRKDHSIVWVNLTVSLLRDEAGQAQYFVAVVEDISQRKALEQELALRQARFDAFFSAAPVGLMILDDQFRYVQINPTLAKLAETSVEFCLGKTLGEIVPDLATTLEPLYEYVLRTGQPILNIEYSGEIPQQPGIEHHWVASYFPLPGQENQPLGIGGVIMEITDRKRAEMALQDLANQKDLLNQLASQIRASLDLNQILKTAVVSTRQVLEVERCHLSWYRPQENPPVWEVLVDANISPYPDLTGSFPASSIGLLNEQVLAGQPLCLNDREILADIQLKQFLESVNFRSVLVMPIHLSKEETGILVLSYTVDSHQWQEEEIQLVRSVCDQLAIAISQAELYQQTQANAQIAQERAQKLELALQELQQTQAQLIQSEKMSSLGQLVAGVAHEINNPVNFIYGNIVHANEYIQDLTGLIELYNQEYPNPAPAIQAEIETIDLEFLLEDLPKLVNSMKVGAERIREIVQSLRNFSRLDEAEVKAVDIHEGIDSTLMILQNRIKARSDRPAVEIIKQYSHLPEIQCYPGQLNQVFMNLLTNALDAMEDFHPSETVSQITIRTQVADNGYAEIQIQDNGPGMTEATRTKLFDPFFTTKPIGKGTGLGLAISYQIITERHQGSLKCLSQPNQGACFIIQLPFSQNILD